MVPKCFHCFIFYFFTGQLRQFEECSSQYEPLATIEEEGFALHYDGRANDATRDGAGQLRFCLRVATGEIHLRVKSYNDGTREGTPWPNASTRAELVCSMQCPRAGTPDHPGAPRVPASAVLNYSIVLRI